MAATPKLVKTEYDGQEIYVGQTRLCFAGIVWRLAEIRQEGILKIETERNGRICHILEGSYGWLNAFKPLFLCLNCDNGYMTDDDYLCESCAENFVE